MDTIAEDSEVRKDDTLYSTQVLGGTVVRENALELLAEIPR